MTPNSMLVLAGNAELERTHDVAYPFRQSSNFLYLTGVDLPDALLVITKRQDGTINEQLYIPQLHPFMGVWEGRSNHIEELKLQSAIDDVQEYEELNDVLQNLVASKPQITFLDMPNSRAAQIAAWQVWQQIKELDPDLELAGINAEIEKLRVVKGSEELESIKEAIRQTELALQHVRPLLAPGVTEQYIAAEFIRFSSERGYQQAFPPIVSFGKSCCTIHHTPDETKLSDSDLVLFDVGVEVDGYAADISRMVTIGKVSDRHNQVLQAVKDVQAAAIALMKPGIMFDEFERQAAQIMAHKLVELGLFESIDQANQPEGELEWPAYRRYFNHMTSHFLGLDAHDVGPRDAKFVPGMVLTCEPGIYIAEEGTGARIEDDILITKDGNINLTADVVLDN